MEFLFQFVAEFLIDLLLQILTEIGWRSMADALRPESHPVLSTIGFSLWGLLAGGLSVWAWPHLFILRHDLRLLNLVVTPLAIAALVRLAGELRRRRDPSMESDPFYYAYAFALPLAAVRYTFAS